MAKGGRVGGGLGGVGVADGVGGYTTMTSRPPRRPATDVVEFSHSVSEVGGSDRVSCACERCVFVCVCIQ